MPEVTADRIGAVRAFNRFYTSLIGLLNAGMHQTSYTLGEARTLYETGRQPGITPTELAGALSMDAGQLSRVLRRLEEDGQIALTPDPQDGRSRRISLTEAGEKTFGELDLASSREIGTLLAKLPERRQAAIISAMAEIATALGGGFEGGEVTFRPPMPGELGWLVHRQAVLYHEEQGWNAEFEALIAGLYRDFEEMTGDPPKRLWIAEMGGAIAGSVYVVPAPGQPGAAQLRMLYVEPFARGRGLGGRLVDEAMRFAREAGYRRIVLWTQDCLVSARRIYQAAGFRLVEEERHFSFGADLNGQYWEFDLSAPQ